MVRPSTLHVRSGWRREFLPLLASDDKEGRTYRDRSRLLKHLRDNFGWLRSRRRSNAAIQFPPAPPSSVDERAALSGLRSARLNVLDGAQRRRRRQAEQTSASET